MSWRWWLLGTSLGLGLGLGVVTMLGGVFGSARPPAPSAATSLAVPTRSDASPPESVSGRELRRTAMTGTPRQDGEEPRPITNALRDHRVLLRLARERLLEMGARCVESAPAADEHLEISYKLKVSAGTARLTHIEPIRTTVVSSKVRRCLFSAWQAATFELPGPDRAELFVDRIGTAELYEAR